MSKSRIPVIIERGERGARFLGFHSGLLNQEFHQPNRLDFKEGDHFQQTRELCEYLRENYPDTPGVHLNYPATGLFIREFSLPFIEKKKVKELVPLELDSILPYEPHDLVYDYKITRDIENNKSHIMSIAAKRDLIEQYIAVFNEYEIPLLSVYPPLDSLYRLDSYVGAENYALFHVSSTTSMIVIIKEGAWSYSRIIPLGYDTLLKWLKNEWKKDYDESRQLLSSIAGSDMESPDYAYFKKHYRLSRPQSQLLLKTIAQFGEKMSAELIRTISLGDQQKPQASPVVLVTDTGNQLMLENLLSARLENPVDTFPYEKSQISILGREFSIPVGAAAGLSSGESFNFLQGDLKKRAKGKKKSRSWVAAGFLAAGVLFFIASFGVDFSEKRKVLKESSASLTEVYKKYFRTDPTDDLSLSAQAQQVVNKEREKTEIHIKFLQKPKVSDLLVALNDALLTITDIDIEKIEYRNEKIRISANTDSFHTLDQIKSSITNHQKFRDIASAKERSMPGAGGSSRVRFSFEVEPELNDEAAGMAGAK